MPRGADPDDWPPSFAGVPVLLTGDFRQAGPVATHGALMQDLHLRNWEHFSWCRVMTLTRNMRAAGNEHFADWLLRLGEGRISDTAAGRSNYVKLPDRWIVHTLDDLIDRVYENDYLGASADRCIVTMRNRVCGNVNNRILSRLPGEVVEKLSVDDVVEDDYGRNVPRNPAANVAGRVDSTRLNPRTEWMQGQITVDMLNQCTPSGMPEHRLKLSLAAEQQHKYDACFVMGDFNLDVDWSTETPLPRTAPAEQFLDAFDNFAFAQLIKNATRTTATSEKTDIWCTNNGMQLNAKKCVAIDISRARQLWTPQYTIGGVALD
ncbi:Hypothetical predicted protein [Cloeon dipterum]|uniref:ATP-dependent DNA helicase n=1 Tax=Cloeon dipterum TaxID=197152 RepID=A0A8S1E1C3_9INSE|nr:Hypothetical predicted protein [Cloeon dipterum]